MCKYSATTRAVGGPRQLVSRTPIDNTRASTKRNDANRWHSECHDARRTEPSNHLGILAVATAA